MIKKFTLFALSFIFIALINSCTKDPASSVNPGGTSIYAFDGTPGSCAAPTVAGIYSIGKTLDASNTLTFTVNVTVKGTYSMNTTNSNGVSFSGSGTFTTTGPQTVVLTGYGTPIKAGNFTYVPVTNNTCNFTVAFLNGPPQAVFTYAGGTGNCTAPQINGVYASNVTLGSGNYVDLAVNVTTPGAYTVSTNTANGFSFSGSGAFTGMGAQVIRLIGNGTPVGQGTFAYTPAGGCSFSITVGGAAPPASFTYNGAPGSCTSPVISGTFAAGTALTSASTIKLGVNVSVAGTYSVTTTSSNGVSFSASGVFPGTGAQTITLTSTNTPTSAGPFTYTPSGGCSFDITYTSAPPPPTEFLKCKINGVLTNFNSLLLGASDQSASPYTFSVSGSNSGGGTDNLQIGITDDASPITNGRSFTNLTLSNLTKGCLVIYSPTFGANPYWASSFMNPGSFTVTITTITATNATGTFTGTLYDNNGLGGNTKNITEGSFNVNY